MNVLILHNNNLPESIFGLDQLANKDTQLFEIDIKPLSERPTDRKDFDVFVSESMSSLELKRYNLIVMPFNFTETYMEYTGLRVAAHIRLTKEWDAQSCPILFLGRDSIEEITRFSSLGEILNTFNIFCSQKKDQESLLNIFKWIDKNSYKNVSTESPLFHSFLDRMQMIPAPSNYATHHSVANEWAIMRWCEIFNWGRLGKPEMPESDFPNMLYFKYLKAKAGVREQPPKRDKNKRNALIPNIKGRKIMLIDDEHNKGWYALLKRIIEDESGAILIKCEEFDKSKTKEVLKKDIQKFISDPENKDIDCYIVDLRLHDDDFNSNYDNTINSELTGIQIINFIKGLNPGNQVVYFTASNKIWNFKKNDDDSNKTLKIIGDNFAIKESPEQNLTTQESYKYFDQLVSAIQHACKMHNLKINYSKIVEFKEKCKNDEIRFSKIDLYNRLIALNDGIRSGDLVDSAALSLSSFIESHIEEVFELSNDSLSKNGEQKGYWHNKFKFNVKKEGKHFNVLSMDYSKDGLRAKDCSPSRILLNDGESDWFYPNPQSPITKIVVALKLYYDFSNDTINDYIQLKSERNKNIAHGSELSSITVEFLQNKIFNIIVIGILNKDIQ